MKVVKGIVPYSRSGCVEIGSRFLKMVLLGDGVCISSKKILDKVKEKLLT